MADSKKLLCAAAGGAVVGAVVKGASDKKKEEKKDDNTTTKKALKTVLGVSAAAIGVNMIGGALSGKTGSSPVSKSEGTHTLSHDDKMAMLEDSPVSGVQESSVEDSMQMGD